MSVVGRSLMSRVTGTATEADLCPADRARAYAHRAVGEIVATDTRDHDDVTWQRRALERIVADAYRAGHRAAGGGSGS